MSGGIAYVLDLEPCLVNLGGVDLVEVGPGGAPHVRELMEVHLVETGSVVARGLLADWPATVRRLTQVLPREYARVLAARVEAERSGRPVDDVVMEMARG